MHEADESPDPSTTTLSLKAVQKIPGPHPDVFDVLSGSLYCRECKRSFPILGGVAILVMDPREYIRNHVKGIARVVNDQDVPTRYRKLFMRARNEILPEHFEEDLESERINALYFMNHYLKVSGSPINWWSPRNSSPSAVIEDLVKKYWDEGPFTQIQRHLPDEPCTLVELGCGTGGLFHLLKPRLQRYLGMDSSFASIALARHLTLGAPYPNHEIKIPEDLLQGSVSREIPADFLAADANPSADYADFIVGEVDNPPLRIGQWQASVALNLIDMLEEVRTLPRLQHNLLKPGGTAIQGCPYIWAPETSRLIRELLPPNIKDSASAAEWLYQDAGFSIEKRIEHIPWLFFKHVRQVELYSVHLFFAKRRS